MVSSVSHCGIRAAFPSESQSHASSYHREWSSTAHFVPTRRQHHRTRQFCRSTTFSDTSADEDIPPDACEPGGTLVKSTRDVLGGGDQTSYSLCYEPSSPRDKMSHLKCDPGTFHQRKKKMQCCKDPALKGKALVAGQKKASMCGDTMAEYYHDGGVLKYTSGTSCEPQSARNTKWGRWFLTKGCHANDPDFFKPVKVGDEACRGEQGTLILRRDDVDNPEKYEFCPAGTAPIGKTRPDVGGDADVSASGTEAGGAGGSLSSKERPYHSWECRGGRETSLTEEFCCNLNGKERCVGSFTDAEQAPSACSCEPNQTPMNLAQFL